MKQKIRRKNMQTLSAFFQSLSYWRENDLILPRFGRRREKIWESYRTKSTTINYYDIVVYDSGTYVEYPEREYPLKKKCGYKATDYYMSLTALCFDVIYIKNYDDRLEVILHEEKTPY